MELDHDEVQVWYAALDQPAWRMAQLSRTLSPDEQERAARFRFEHDRYRFIAGRGILRELLARCLAVDPGDVVFSYGPHGKPALAGRWRGELLRFNLAHSAGVALCALAHGREVGVDVEALRPTADLDQIAERFFSAQERAALRALPRAAQLAAFFRCWTRKEAYIKARSTGLSFPLDQFDVALDDDRRSALLEVRGEPGEAARWLLRDLPAGQGFVAALAVEGHSCRLTYQTWPDAVARRSRAADRGCYGRYGV
jgi:4'-phosphopantetheinyl transferase